MTTTLRDLLLRGYDPVPREECELLLAHILTKNREFILAHPEYPIEKSIQEDFFKSIARRTQHEPLALILGRKEFYGRDFIVNSHTLIPRPETELLIEKALSLIENSNASSRILIADIGIGSGNIITTIACECKNISIPDKQLTFLATDISEEAIRVAQTNAHRLAPGNKIHFFRSDLLNEIPTQYFENSDIILLIGNLPYLSRDRFESAPEDVRMYEPTSALLSGEDGLDHIRRLLKGLSRLRDMTTIKKTVTHVFLEIDPEQKRLLSKISGELFPSSRIEFFTDLAQRIRVVHILISDAAGTQRNGNIETSTLTQII